MTHIPIVSTFLDIVQWIALAIGALMIVAMGVLLNFEVASRSMFGISTQIADEFAGYFFTAATLLCFLPALREGRFLIVEGLVQRLPRRIQAVLRLIAAGLGAGVSVVLAFSTFDLAATSFAYGSVSLQAFQTPLFIPQSIMPVGFALLALGFLEQGVIHSSRLWRGEVRNAEPSHAVD
jgi:TRAP-type transport system small permease protein